MKTAISILCTFCIVTASQAGDWPQWRGPNFNGSTDETNLPSNWSTTENVVWAADLPGASASTPIIWQDRVFVSATDSAKDTLVAMCLERTTGDLVWKDDVAKGIRKDSRSNFASSSPVTDGNVVVYFYGSGHLVAYTLEGSKLWSRNVQDDFGPFAFQWTFSSSPVLYEGTLYLQVLQRDVSVRGRGFRDRKNDSYLLAMEPQTGELIWRHVRPSQAVAESLESFTTPVPFEYQGRKELLVAGGDDLTGHDPKTGKELWRWGTWNPQRIGHWRLVPSPVASQDVILACAPKGDPIYAVKAGGNGDLDDSDLAWVSRDERTISSDVPTPAYYDGDFFILSDVRKTLSRVEPSTGQIKWSVSTPGRRKYEASPLAADGKIYLVNFDGTVVVVDAESGEIISEISMSRASEDPVRSSVVAAHGNLFVKTNEKLFCIGR